jgi:hypothetical protein
MIDRFFRTLFASSILVFACGILHHNVVAQESNSVLSLAGRWAGVGTMIPASGPSEIFRCVVTYFPTGNGSRLKQNLRCKSASYQFDGSAQLQIDAGKITGRWQEKVNSLNGTVTGNMTSGGFLILLNGDVFSAKMTVMNSPCRQSVTIVPEEGTPLKSLSAVLKKC